MVGVYEQILCMNPLLIYVLGRYLILATDGHRTMG